MGSCVNPQIPSSVLHNDVARSQQGDECNGPLLTETVKTVSFRDVVAPPHPIVPSNSFANVTDHAKIVDGSVDENGLTGFFIPEPFIFKLSESYKFALVGKILGNRRLVPNQKISQSFSKVGLVGTFSLNFLPRGFLVVVPALEEDYVRLWDRGGLQVGPLSVRFSKWTPEFQLQQESSIAKKKKMNKERDEEVPRFKKSNSVSKKE